MLPNEILRSYIDDQMQKLERVRFRPDPLLGYYSVLHSLLSSAPKRHGGVIELAICQALRQSGDYRVWSTVKFNIPASADLITTSQDAAACLVTRLPYGGGRQVRVDLIAYHLSSQRLGAYEIKRANSRHDAGKVRSLRRDIMGTQTVIASYAQTLGLQITEAISRGIFYYGRGLLPRPLSLMGSELDMHFGCAVRSVVEDATVYFQSRLYDFLQGVDTRLDRRQLELAFNVKE